MSVSSAISGSDAAERFFSPMIHVELYNSLSAARLFRSGECFSTRVLQNLRVPQVASKGSGESKQETETK